MVYGMPALGRWVLRKRAVAAAPARDKPSPLPWPLAAATIGALSLALWVGICWTVVALF